MWSVATYAFLGALATVFIWLSIRLLDEINQRVRVEKDAQHDKDLRIRAICQLRQEIAHLKATLEAFARQEEDAQHTAPVHENVSNPSAPNGYNVPYREESYTVIAAQTPPAINRQEVSPLKVVSVINYKGGVGKTTITSNIAAYAASEGKRVLMIDLDPQTNLTFSFMSSKEWEDEYAKSKTLKNFFLPIINGAPKQIDLGTLVIPLKVQGLNMGLISSHLELIDIDTDLAACLGGANINIMNRNFLRVHSHLREGLSKLKNDYDLILIDCPPNFNTVVKNAITASDYYLVPAKMDYLSTLGIEQLYRNTFKYAKNYNEYIAQIGEDEFSRIKPKLLGVVPTMLTLYNGAPIQANQHYIDQVKSQGYYLFPWLRENSSIYAPAPQNGIPVILSSLSVTPTARGVLDELRDMCRNFTEKLEIIESE